MDLQRGFKRIECTQTLHLPRVGRRHKLRNVVSNYMGLIFGEVLANEFHISLLLYAMVLCALKFYFRNSSFKPRVYRKPSLNPTKEASCKDHVSRRCKLTVLSY